MNNWTSTADALPPAGVRCIIETIVSARLLGADETDTRSTGGRK